MVVYTPVAEDPAVAELHAHAQQLAASSAVDQVKAYVDQLTTGGPATTAALSGGVDAGPTDTVGGLRRVYQEARRDGLDEAGARAAAAVALTEGGMGGALGDKKRSGGTLQLYFGGGQGNAWAKAVGLSEPEALARLGANPFVADDWALRPGGYLGDAIRAGEAQGLTGADLATYAQRTGQKSVSPDRAGANYQRLWSGGAGMDDLVLRPEDPAVTAARPLTGHEVRDQRGNPIRGTDDLTVRPWDAPARIEPIPNAPNSQAARGAIIDRAKDYLGTPYQWGGTTKQGIDCSAFISEAWGLPRQTTDTLAKVATPIAPTQLEPGDALNLTTQQDPRGYGHVRMFAGWADPAHRTMAVYESSSTTGGVVQRVIPYDPAYTPMRLNTLAAAAPGPTGPSAADLGSRDDWRHASRMTAPTPAPRAGFTPGQPGADILDRGDMYGSGLLGGEQAAVDPQVDWAKLFPAPPVLPLIRSPEQDAGTLSTDVQPYSGPFAGLLDPAKFRAGGVDAAFTPGM